MNSKKLLFFSISPISLSANGESNHNWLGLTYLPDNTEGERTLLP